MTEVVATNIMVFGRAMDPTDPSRLSEAAVARVDTALGYIAAHRAVFEERRGRIVFSGGWAAAAHGTAQPLVELREGTLMLERAQRRGVEGDDLAKFADAYAEIDSDSTLENPLRTKEAGFFEGVRFSRDNPLGLVAQAAHMARVDYFTRKAFRLRRTEVLHIIAPEPDCPSVISESVLYPLTRLACAGAYSAAALRRREQRMLRMARLLRR